MLDEQLQKLAASDQYPFHMPGHKRHMEGIENPWKIDITEISGFDDLHHPEGLILEAMQELAQLYHSDRSYLMVNGSTGGNLAAIFAATKQKDSIIIGRNSHKSIYHGVQLRQLEVHYTYPVIGSGGMVLGTPIEEYKRAMAEAPHAKALVVTSPTYEGMTEPLEEIAALAHHHNMAVIVDAAHGAHLGFHPYFPPSPVATGADVVIMSLHKTLPSLTQTAVLHYCGQQERDSSTGVSRQRIEEYLSYFQTSSPSYVLMASICRCIRFLREQPQAFATYAELLQEYYEKFEKLKYFDISCKPGQDPSKIVIDTSKTSLTGQALMERLEQDYHLKPEMASFSYVLAMTSVMDTRQGMDRLYNALKELDAEEDGKPIRLKDQKNRSTDYLRELYAKPVKVMESWEAADRKHRIVPIIKAEGQVAAKEVALYPPGVPLLVPGEVIKKKQLLLLSEAQDMGLTVTGTEGKDKKGLSVVI